MGAGTTPVEILLPTKTRSASGESVKSAVKVADRWVSIIRQEAVSAFAGDQEQTQVRVVLEMPYDSELPLTTSHWLAMDARIFHIAGFSNVKEKNRAWRLHCVEALDLKASGVAVFTHSLDFSRAENSQHWLGLGVGMAG